MKRKTVSIDDIESLRRELNELGKKRGMNDPAVLALSQQLDDLIVRYTKGQLAVKGTSVHRYGKG
ncbi:aspartyl-phosphate phosphatase Spo0E family protein [Brevibacillus migulae]|uniref:aspartyl-phosphate phosphatase Spo0E family protein n=1 Tax=Brevibacillus migulae TaxID=1644114 RepID=UPI00196AE6F5|nr:aspartyl-phosphate phosphatase Spo0E family protein [Brevibacillus migulae]